MLYLIESFFESFPADLEIVLAVFLSPLSSIRQISPTDIRNISNAHESYYGMRELIGYEHGVQDCDWGRLGHTGFRKKKKTYS